MIKVRQDTYPRLQAYFAELKKATGLDTKEITQTIGTTGANHAFSEHGVQWYLPSRETYDKLLTLPRNETFKLRRYEVLKRMFDQETQREIRRLKIPPACHFEYQQGFMEVIDCSVNSTNRKHRAKNPCP